jgi:Rps23 Pro-64 3,4-dihydroxylase Tpa1-like proline 4-hydroxylase
MLYTNKGYYAGSGLEFFGKSYELLLNQYLTKIIDYKEFEYQIVYSLKEVYNVRLVPPTDLETQNNYKEAIVTKHKDLAQIWFEHLYKENADCALISNYCYSKLQEIFPTNKYKYSQPSFNLSLYNKDCFIKNHKDGEDNDSTRVCVLLLYLNKDWKKGDGGELIITDLDGNKLEITPEFGNFAILDFTNANLEHEVTPIVNPNFERKALISFIMNAK